MANDIMTQVYEIMGKAGFINYPVGTPEHDQASFRFLTLSNEELRNLEFDIVAPSGHVVNWNGYLFHNAISSFGIGKFSKTLVFSNTFFTAILLYFAL